MSRDFKGDASIYGASGNAEGTVLAVVNYVMNDELRAMVSEKL